MLTAHFRRRAQASAPRGVSGGSAPATRDKTGCRQGTEAQAASLPSGLTRGAHQEAARRGRRGGRKRRRRRRMPASCAVAYAAPEGAGSRASGRAGAGCAPLAAPPPATKRPPGRPGSTRRARDSPRPPAQAGAASRTRQSFAERAPSAPHSPSMIRARRSDRPVGSGGAVQGMNKRRTQLTGEWQAISLTRPGRGERDPARRPWRIRCCLLRRAGQGGLGVSIRRPDRTQAGQLFSEGDRKASRSPAVSQFAIFWNNRAFTRARCSSQGRRSARCAVVSKRPGAGGSR